MPANTKTDKAMKTRTKVATKDAPAAPHAKAKAEPQAATPRAKPAMTSAKIADKAASILDRVNDAASLQVLGHLHEQPLSSAQIQELFPDSGEDIKGLIGDLRSTKMIEAGETKGHFVPTDRGKVIWAMARSIAGA